MLDCYQLRIIYGPGTRAPVHKLGLLSVILGMAFTQKPKQNQPTKPPTPNSKKPLKARYFCRRTLGMFGGLTSGVDLCPPSPVFCSWHCNQWYEFGKVWELGYFLQSFFLVLTPPKPVQLLSTSSFQLFWIYHPYILALCRPTHIFRLWFSHTDSICFSLEHSCYSYLL